MYYLIVAMWTYSTVIIPEKYYSLDSCNKAGKSIVTLTESNKYYACVPAPDTFKYCEYHYEDLSMTDGHYSLTRKVCN